MKQGTMAQKACNLRVLVTPAPDVSGQWVAHCLDVDIVTQGNDLPHALRMLNEAIRLSFEVDLDDNVDPLSRPRAPEACFDVWERVYRHGKPIDSVGAVAGSDVSALIAMVRVVRPIHPIDHEWHEEVMPPAWLCAQFNGVGESSSPSPCC